MPQLRSRLPLPPGCETDEHAHRSRRTPPSDAVLDDAARMFEAAGNTERLALLLLLREGPRSVSALAEALGREPSLVSQHLGVLRQARLARGVREGRFVRYELFDAHAHTFIESAIAHAVRLGRSRSGR